MRWASVEALEHELRGERYLPDHGLAVSAYLALRLRRPLLLEGEAGVGKTEIAKTLARLLGAELVRLQCYEGIDAAQALYEWDYARQLLYARTVDGAGSDPRESVSELYDEAFLLERPLLRALRAEGPTVLLIDEIDRADDEFEAFLLEVLSDFSLTIPELGTITARERPFVVLTSNRTRDLHHALTRRCLYHWIDYPQIDREVEIIRLRAPEVTERLARSVAAAIARLRDMDLAKHPGVAESIDWAQALAALGSSSLTAEDAGETLGWAVKNRDDMRLVRGSIEELVGG